ncbi:DJ-1/PfpI family protein [Kibdelosporangium persicum]|uniref:Transcriptional regulator containing an amidase domain and an AraC-type DNA-binding HTH domain n=1 Tax=Kibdelosporangium persicum TaxID=2698649 RepID=A0ABX2F7T5_9PSEU|nr:DJ-1/PfpI family protein [Kibdelosporangium persicum]NRN67414.1 Transcriptional regulator containing an amidase domain and an AraC-type DNA-binding HTH domain [Kibdelosporangium persicum]
MLRVRTVLYEGVEPQDFIGPITALEVADGVECRYVGVDGPGTVTTSAGFDIAVRDLWSEADVILVPGGGYGEGSPVDREVRRGAIAKAVQAAQRPGMVVGSVCTGTLLLGEIVSGRPCTTHHAALEDLRAMGATVVSSRVVDDGDLVTAGGVTSGLDLGLWLVERFFGIDTALMAQQVIEFERRGPVWRERQRTIE